MITLYIAPYGSDASVGMAAMMGAATIEEGQSTVHDTECLDTNYDTEEHSHRTLNRRSRMQNASNRSHEVLTVPDGPRTSQDAPRATNRG